MYVFIKHIMYNKYIICNALLNMPLGKPKIKTATMNLRVEPQIKVAAEAAAKLTRRSVTSFIEVLVLDYCEKMGIELTDKSNRKAKHE